MEKQPSRIEHTGINNLKDDNQHTYPDDELESQELFELSSPERLLNRPATITTTTNTRYYIHRLLILLMGVVVVKVASNITISRSQYFDPIRNIQQISYHKQKHQIPLLDEDTTTTSLRYPEARRLDNEKSLPPIYTKIEN